MSNYGSESGTFHLSASDLSRMRRRFHEHDTKQKKAVYEQAQEFWKGLSRAQQANPEKYQEAQRVHAGRVLRAHGEDSMEEFVRSTSLRYSMDPETRGNVPKKPERVKQSDIDWANANTMSFREGDLSVHFDKADSTVTYVTDHNNRAPEHAEETKLAELFHHQMRSNRYRKDDGGHMTKTDEYGTEATYAIGPRGWQDAPEAAVDYTDSRDVRHNARAFINTGLNAQARPSGSSGTQVRKGQQGVPTTNRGHFGSTVRDEPRGL